MDLEWLHLYATRWHDAWEIAGAIATSLAVVIALWGTLHATRATARAEARAQAAEAARDHERTIAEARRDADDLKQREELRRAQAARITVWVERGGLPFVGEAEAPHVLRVVNHSDVPAFDVRAHVFTADTASFPIIQRVVLPAGESIATVLPDNLQDDERPVAFVYFHDLAGVSWRRDQTGDLQELDQQGHPV